jgi:membrane-bound lytic murein transglycosylase B
MTGRRDRACRAVLSALACGLMAVGLGGVIPAGALGAGVRAGTAPSPEGSSTTGTSSGGSAAQSGPGQSPTTTSTTPTSTSPRAGTPAPAAPQAPMVVLQRGQRTTAANDVSQPATSTGPSTTAGENARPPLAGTKHRPKSANTTAGGASAGGGGASGPSNVAPAPQLVAGQAAATEAALGSSLASLQALGFYRIPLFLLPIYKAAAVQYGVPWQILAAINEIETDYGSDQSVSTAGAVGWMQFMPATWLQYGVDALDAGYADPYNPVDAIFAAARYLRAAGAATDLHAAILAYNHSEEYASSVLLRAELISSYPTRVIATLTGLSTGRLPVTGKQLVWFASSLPPAAGSGATAVGEVSSRLSAASAASGSASLGQTGASAATAPSPAAAAARARTHPAAERPLWLAELTTAPNASVVAVQDGRIVRLGDSRRLGKYLVLRDVYGDLFTYAGLGSIARSYVLPKAQRGSQGSPAVEAASRRDPMPSQPASAGSQPPITLQVKPADRAPAKARDSSGRALQVDSAETAPAAAGKLRLFAHPGNPDALAAAALAARMAPRKGAGGRLPVRAGSVVAAGTVLGQVRVPRGALDGHLRFAIRPAGDPSTVDPAPILANWAQLQLALHPQGAKAQNTLLGATASDVFLMSTDQLEAAVLSDPGITLDACGRGEIASGKVERRVLAVLAFLSRSGLEPSVTGLRCDQRQRAAADSVSAQNSVSALDISAVNGVAIAGHQGAGTITDLTIRTLLALPSGFVPHEIISLMRYPGAPNTHARPSHSAYIELVFSPPKRASARKSTATTIAVGHSAGSGRSAPSPSLVSYELTAAEWDRLIERVAALPVPTVARKPSSSAIPDANGP